MFYSQFILAKKGPLGTIWIAAHLERKLRKNQVADTDIGVSVDSILFPEVPIALRLSSHLLLGVVRIYSKKVSYLFDDCSEALLKVKQAFRSTAVDLPPEQSKAPYHSITLPETFDLDDFELPDNDAFQGNFVDHHVSTREQITLQDTMDGVSFPTSQFGPDERFGDGDASQFGLDLDEELFMDKGDAAGTSGLFVGKDAGPQASAKESSSSKGEEHDDVVFDPPLGSTTNYFSIQAPSTPGLNEEPNLPSSKEELQVSDDHMDDHMDEDQNPCELAAKKVAGTALSPIEPSDMGGAEFQSIGTLHYMDEKDKKDVQTLGTESLEFISSGFAQPSVFSVHLEATNGQHNVEIIPNSSLPLESERIMDVQGCDTFVGYNKTDLNGTYHPLHGRKEESKTSDGPAVLGTAEAVASSEIQNSFQSCPNLEISETFESNFEKSSAFTTPVLQACSSKVSVACAGVNNVLDSSNLPAQDGGRSFGMTGMEETTNASQILTNVEDEGEPTSNVNHIVPEVSCVADSNFQGKLDNFTAEDNHSEKENNLQLSDFPHPEVLLSVPDFPAGPSHNFLDDSTPSKEFFAKDGDATDENLISGRKRSFTEGTLTLQSYNSVESGGAQFKGTVETVPDDNDLLSSILAGKKSMTFKMKPTPPVPDTSRAKRQRTAVRSVAHKRKVLVDDSTVLHGDTIRQQLTNTEDIRRVRKKAPCTHLEVWVLQKQFLEDEIFSEPVFTGMFPALRSLNTEAFDLSGIRIIKDSGNKGASEADISTRSPTLDEEIEAVGTLAPSTADISTRPMLNEETEAVESLVSSSAGGEGLQGSGGKLLGTPCEQESALLVDGGTLLNEMQAGGDELMKEMLHFDREKAGLEFDDTRTLVGGEAIGTEPLSSVAYVSEANCTSTDHIKLDSPSFDKTSDVVMSTHLDESSQLLDQRCVAQCTIGDASTAEDVLGTGTQDQVLDDGVSERIKSDERFLGEHVLEKREGLDVNLVMENFQDTCSLPVHNFGTSESVTVDGIAGRTSDQVGDCRQDELDIAYKDETFDSGLRDDGCCLTSHDVTEQLKLDSLMEADLSSQKTKLIESEDLPFWEDDPKIDKDSTPILPEFTEIGNNDALRTDAMEHDTDFLNVDDDDVVEDYESDMPDPEERRILDNSGWSSRTRAVANYLQVLFEKESDQDKKVVSLENLLAGKTRKEASRMFFETLVLKTKDYIQAEQESSFCDVKIKPRGKLLKSDF